MSTSADEAISQGADGAWVGRVENTNAPVSAGRIREWLGDPAARIHLTQVIHTGEPMHSDAYEIPHRLVRQIEVTELTCVFPWCDKPATVCDKDQRVPYGEGGPTSSGNLGPLCRWHHQRKTHATWRYIRHDDLDLGPAYIWTSPYGLNYIRDRTGTRAGPPGDGPFTDSG